MHHNRCTFRPVLGIHENISAKSCNAFGIPVTRRLFGQSLPVRASPEVVEQAEVADASCGLQSSVTRDLGVGQVGRRLVHVHAYEVAGLLGKLKLFAVEEILAGIELVEGAAVKRSRGVELGVGKP